MQSKSGKVEEGLNIWTGASLGRAQRRLEDGNAVLERTTAPFTCVGGPHTKFHHEKIRRQGARAVFVDDAEHTFVQWLEQGCPDGTFFGGQVPLDELPLPRRELVNLDDYKILDSEGLLFNVGNLRLPIYTSNGCPLKCTYCDVQQKTYNFMSPERCLEEFQAMLALGAASIHILDDAFNTRKDRVQVLGKVLAEHHITIDWSARGTVEIREEVIASIAEGGCKRLHVGTRTELKHMDNSSVRCKHLDHPVQPARPGQRGLEFPD